MVTLPYKLREGQKAYAAKVMANLEALLGAYNRVQIDGIGNGSVSDMFKWLAEEMVKANEAGNTSEILFPDGESVEDKFSAGTLNASILNTDGLFYCTVGDDGHLYITASDDFEESQFSIDPETRHLIYTLRDPDEATAVHTYDLGNVMGPEGPSGVGDMSANVYDPNNRQTDLNTYTGYYTCLASGWGDYFLTYDTTAQEGKTYYIFDGSDTYTAASVTVGAPLAVNTYYEKLPINECLITDINLTTGEALTGLITGMTGHVMMGPSYDATDEAHLAWSAGLVVGVGQGSGNSAPDASNSSSWLRLRELGTPIEINIPLVLTLRP